MYEQFLSQTGLSKEQAVVYETLVRQGPLPAGKISAVAGLKRGLTYKVLGELEKMGLIEKKDEPGKVLRFEAMHPLRMRDLLEKRTRETKDAREVLETVLPKLVSDFNLVSGKPGIQFYEGREAVERITTHSLGAKEEIYSYIDNEAVDKYLPKENKRYVAERVRRGIRKKIISPDTAHTREIAAHFAEELLEARVLPIEKSLQTVMQIYDDTVSYLTINDERMIGVIIEDRFIARMHRTTFEYLWSVAKPIPEQAGHAAIPMSGEDAKVPRA